jgi:prevent-host-death family protein
MYYTVREVKKNLARLLEDVQCGNEIVILKNGEPVAKLIPLARIARGKKRQPGTLKGKITYDENAFAPLTTKELKDLGFE